MYGHETRKGKYRHFSSSINKANRGIAHHSNGGNVGLYVRESLRTRNALLQHRSVHFVGEAADLRDERPIYLEIDVSIRCTHNPNQLTWVRDKGLFATSSISNLRRLERLICME